MNTKPGKTLYYPGNSAGKEPTIQEFVIPFGVRISDGAVKKITKLVPWDQTTRFYECIDFNLDCCHYGTALELSVKISCSEKVVKSKAKKQTAYRERYLIQEIGIEEFFKQTKRFKREISCYAKKG